MMKEALHPILSCEDAAALEGSILQDEDAEWAAMERAGRTLGQRLLADSCEAYSMPFAPGILILLSKGHNSGDACIAADEILGMMPDADIRIYSLVDESEMRPLCRRAYELIADRVTQATLEQVSGDAFALCIDGLFGMQFKPPLREDARALLDAVNENRRIRLRVAVDLPSGLGDEGAFHADLTYTMGIAKKVLFEKGHDRYTGRIRSIDIGFFPEGVMGGDWDPPFLLTSRILEGLRRMRPAQTNKQKQGHLFMVAGSRNMPGAMLMAARAAATSGLGLLTVFGPESVIPSLVGSLPEAMWVPMPETPGGGLAMEGRREVLSRLDRADAVLFGPGMGRESETARLMHDLLGEIRSPVLMDADALQPSTVSAAANRPDGFGKVVITPHEGEFKRISGENSPDAFVRNTGLLLVLKGPLTRIYQGSNYMISPFGGPVLARGGSGDLLSGMIGARMAGAGSDLLQAVCEGVVWHGRAADEWARERGAVGVRTTGLLEYLPEGLFYE